MANRIAGTEYIVRQQLFTVHSSFDVTDAAGNSVMAAHGNGLRVMDKLGLDDPQGNRLLDIHQKPGARPKVDVSRNGTTIVTVSERRAGVRDHFVFSTKMPATFDITGNAWSTNYQITINGVPAAQVYMEPGLMKADTYHVIIGERRKPAILMGLILAVDILSHQGKR